MTAVLLVITTRYTLVQVSFVGSVSTVVVVVSLLGGASVVAVGYVSGWPTVPMWASNLTGGFAVLAGTGYLLYRQVESYRNENQELPT